MNLVTDVQMHTNKDGVAVKWHREGKYCVVKLLSMNYKMPSIDSILPDGLVRDKRDDWTEHRDTDGYVYRIPILGWDVLRPERAASDSIDDLKAEKHALIVYMFAKIKSQDWSAVSEAANSLRVIAAKLEDR